jgi:hypothetical protein
MVVVGRPLAAMVWRASRCDDPREGIAVFWDTLWKAAGLPTSHISDKAFVVTSVYSYSPQRQGGREHVVRGYSYPVSL